LIIVGSLMTTNIIPAKILTVDDEVALRQSIVAYLEDSGFEICEAENGKQGLEVFEREKPDLVLTDIQMPVMDGLTLLGEIIKRSPKTPVIVVSGAGSMEDVIEAMRLGAWDYVTKPVADLSILELIIKKSLDRYHLVQENEENKEKVKHSLQILQEDQEAGRSVQMSLLPEKCQIISNYLFNYSVTPSLYLSGDFLEYFVINEEKIGVYLADVSGHGASSAFVTVLLQSLIHQMNSKYHSRDIDVILYPEKFLAYLGSEIYSAKLGKYLTMVYGVIDTKTGDFVYCVAGHYPNPIILRGSGEVSYLPGSGFPVGIMRTTTYKAEKVKLDVKDKIILFSDGVMEIFMKKQGMLQKDPGLLELVKKTNAEIPAILKELGLDGEKKHDQPDDVTMLQFNRT
jgi:phosphoserine phosphatase RsbU/P